MRKRIVLVMLIAAGAVALSASTAPAQRAVASAAHPVPVQRCQTTFGISGVHNKVPSQLNVLGASGSVSGLVAYTNTVSYVIAPSGMQCSGQVAADGGVLLVVWPRGQSQPSLSSHGDGVTLSIDTACAGCKAADACPFFRQFAVPGVSCPSQIPAGERVRKLNAHTELFQDAAGVAGDGWPSGGSDPADGLVGIHGSLKDGEVYKTTCTLPAAIRGACATTLGDVIDRYGGGGA